MPEDSKTQGPAGGHEALIVAIASSGDRAAFATLFQHFAPRIKTLLLRSGTPSELAEELAQEAMLTVWRKAHLFDPVGANASGWIFRIAHNLRVDAARKVQRADRLARELAFEATGTDAVETSVVDRQAERKVRTAMAQLAPEQLAVITLSFFEGRPHSEIAELLQVPLGTVKSRIRLAFRRLRALLEEVA